MPKRTLTGTSNREPQDYDKYHGNIRTLVRQFPSYSYCIIGMPFGVPISTFLSSMAMMRANGASVALQTRLPNKVPFPQRETRKWSCEKYCPRAKEALDKRLLVRDISAMSLQPNVLSACSDIYFPRTKWKHMKAAVFAGRLWVSMLVARKADHTVI